MINHSLELPMPHFDAYEDLVGKWRWRLVASNGRTAATSGESFPSHWHALRSAEDTRNVASRAHVRTAIANGVNDALSAIIERESMQNR